MRYTRAIQHNALLENHPAQKRYNSTMHAARQYMLKPARAGMSLTELLRATARDSQVTLGAQVVFAKALCTILTDRLLSTNFVPLTQSNTQRQTCWKCNVFFGICKRLVAEAEQNHMP